MCCYFLSFLFLLCGFWKVAAAAGDAEVVGDDTPSIAGIGESHRANTAAGDNSSLENLFQTGNCPLNPKPACEDPSCEGITSMGSNLAQYTCSNQRPVHLSEGSAPVIIFQCHCCPLPLHVTCTDSDCAATLGTRICLEYPLRGCACQTHEDRQQDATQPDPSDPGGRLYPQPNNPPPSSIEDMMRLLQRFHGMGRYVTRNETMLEQLRLAGVDPPREIGTANNVFVVEERTPPALARQGTNSSNSGSNQEEGTGQPEFTRTIVSLAAVIPTAVGVFGSRHL